jgi:hypothetical protein
VTLRHLDVKVKDIPEDLVEKYDIVHIRTFAFVLRDAEIPQVLENLTKLLSNDTPSTNCTLRLLIRGFPL